MNIIKSLCIAITFFTCIHLLGGVEVPSYVIVGLDTNIQGSLNRSLDAGRTWQQRWGNGIRVNYALAVHQDGRIFYRDQNNHIHVCPTAGEAFNEGDCSEPSRGYNALVLAAGTDGMLYSIADSNNIRTSGNGGGSWDYRCGQKGSATTKAMAPYANHRVFVLQINGKDIVDFSIDACDTKVIYTGVNISAIAASANGELWIVDNWDGRPHLHHRWFSDGHAEEVGIDFTDVAIAPDGTVFGLKSNRELWNSKDNGKTWNLVANNLPVDRIVIQPISAGSASQSCENWCNDNIKEPNDFNVTNGSCKKVCADYGQLSEIRNNDTNRLVEDVKICVTANDDLRKSIIDAIYEIGAVTKFADKTDVAVKKTQIIINKLQTSLANCGATSSCDGTSRDSRGYTKTAKSPIIGPTTACTQCSVDSLTNKAAAMVTQAQCIDQLPGLEWLFDYLNGELERCISAATAKSAELSTLTNKMQCLKNDLDACINS